MRQIEVSETRRKLGGRKKIVIPGGWVADVPEVSVSRTDARVQSLMSALQSVGASPLQAEDVVRDGISELFVGAWVTNLKQFVARAAEIHVVRGGSIDTFDPERLQMAYIPGTEKVWYGKRNLILQRILGEMR